MQTCGQLPPVSPIRTSASRCCNRWSVPELSNLCTVRVVSHFTAVTGVWPQAQGWPHRFQETPQIIVGIGQALWISHVQFVNNNVNSWFRNSRSLCLKFEGDTRNAAIAEKWLLERSGPRHLILRTKFFLIQVNAKCQKHRLSFQDKRHSRKATIQKGYTAATPALTAVQWRKAISGLIKMVQWKQNALPSVHTIARIVQLVSSRMTWKHLRPEGNEKRIPGVGKEVLQCEIHLDLFLSKRKSRGI